MKPICTLSIQIFIIYLLYFVSLPEPENESDFDEEDQSSKPSDSQGPDTIQLPLAAVEHQVELLLEEWNKGADMLFSIHPMDGSLLVWHVDWIDEYQPGMFRQAQVLDCLWLRCILSKMFPFYVCLINK